MRWKWAFVFTFIIFFISFSSASFIFSNIGSSISNQYGIPDYTKARINISFQNESVNSIFRDSLGNWIQLGALLDIVGVYDYAFNDTTNKTIDSTFHILVFDKANFSLPEVTGNFTYQLNFSGKELFKEQFKIISVDNSLRKSIDEKNDKFDEYKTEIKKYDLSVQEILNQYFNVTSLDKDFKNIETQYQNAKTSQEYAEVSENLSKIIIPEEITENVKTTPITFYPNKDTINLEILKNIGAGDYGKNEEGYIDAVFAWNQNNFTTKLTFKEILINYGEEQTILRIFEFEFENDIEENTYFIIGPLEDLRFDKNYSQAEESDYTYINLYENSDKITFSTTEDVDFLDVPVFTSPSLDYLQPVIIDFPPVEDKLSKWVLFGLIVFLLILIAIIAYVIIQAWYRRKYENYLFKNRNNLYNIMTYIQNAKKRGMERDDIMKNLKKAGWNREQINYAIRKYEGKKIIGIIERPFKKVIEEIEKRPRENIR